MEAPTLQGERVRLRQLTPADAEAVAAIRSLPEVARWWRHADTDDVRAALQEEHLACWVVELDGGLIGFVQAWEDPDPEYRHAGLDLFLHPALHRRHLGREVVRLVARHLFEDRGHHRLFIDPSLDNTVAIRCYQAVGFHPIGVARQQWWDHVEERWADALLLELLAPELT